MLSARARALSIERTELHLARQEGEAIGQARGREEGRAEGEAIGQARGEAIGQARGRAEGEAVGEARGRSEGRAAAIREVLDALADGNITPAQLRKQLGSDPS